MKLTDILLIGLFPAILLGILIYYNITTFQTWSQQKQLANSGEKTRAIIIDKQVFKSTKGGDAWTIKYQYQINNIEYIKEQDVPQNYFNIYPLNSEIEILYLKDNPKVSNIPSNSYTSFYIYLILILDLLVISTLIYGFIKYSS